MSIKAYLLLCILYVAIHVGIRICLLYFLLFCLFTYFLVQTFQKVGFFASDIISMFHLLYFCSYSNNMNLLLKRKINEKFLLLSIKQFSTLTYSEQMLVAFVFVHTKTRNNLTQAGTTWNKLERAKSLKTRWNHLKRDVPSNELTLKTRHSWDQTLRAILQPNRTKYQQQLLLQEYNLKCLLLGLPVTEWNQYRGDTQKRDPGQHYVYNQTTEYNFANICFQKDVAFKY